MKKFATMVTSVALIGAMVAGGSLAYLSDTDSAVNVMTLGNVSIEQIEQERNAEGKLVDFTQNKPALPAVGPIEWADKGVDVNGTEYKVFTDDLKNVVDKIVTVKNTGKSDAYVRTIIAIEAPEGDPNDLIHINYNTDGLDMAVGNKIVINGDDYVYFTFTYKDALAPKTISAPSLMQLFLDKVADNKDCAKFGDTWEVLVLSQAVQSAGFENAQVALDEAFGVIDDTAATALFSGMTIVSSNDDLKKAIENENVTTIYVDGNLTFDWGSDSYANSKALAMAGKTIAGLDKDASITFKGYGSANPITDVTLKDITVYDATEGDNEGAWEHGHLEFVSLTAENVVFANSIMLDGVCELTNCSVPNEVASWYGAWVEGGNVTFDNCEFTGTRGIKIHEAYGSEVKSVKVNDCVFKLSEKPGVVIGDLNANTAVKITNSAFDYQAGDQGKYIYESDTDVATFKFTENNNTLATVVADVVELKDAVKAKNKTVVVSSGTYDMSGNFSIAEGVTLIGSGDVVFEGTLTSTLKDVEVKNVTFKGNNAQRWAYAKGDLVFEDCTFDADSVYAIHFDGTSGADIVYKNCDITGWVAIAGGHNSLTFDGCTINGNGTYGVIRTYSDATIKNCTFDVDNVNTTDVYQDGIHAVGCTITVENCTNVNGNIEDLFNVSNAGTIVNN